MSRAKATSVAARFDPDPEHILLTRVEFDRLCEVARIPEKENFFFLCGLLIPCGIAIFSEYPAAGEAPSTKLLLNFIVVVVAGLLAFFQGRGWYSKRRAFKDFVGSLEERPTGRLAFSEPQTRIYVNQDSSKTAG